jgi:hypothetical protein
LVAVSITDTVPSALLFVTYTWPPSCATATPDGTAPAGSITVAVTELLAVSITETVASPVFVM